MNVELSKGIRYTSYYNNMYGKMPMFILEEDIADIDMFDYDLPNFDAANQYRDKEIVPQTLKQQILLDKDLATEDKVFIKDCIYPDNLLIRYNTDDNLKDYVVYTFNFTTVNENLVYISLDKISTVEENLYAYSEQVCRYVVDCVKVQIEESYNNLKDFKTDIEFELSIPNIDEALVQIRYIKDKRDTSSDINADAISTTYAIITRAPELVIWKGNIYSGEDILYSEEKQDLLWSYFLDNDCTIFCGIKPIKRTRFLNYTNKKLKFYNVIEYTKAFTIFENMFSNLFLTLVDYKEVNDIYKDGNSIHFSRMDVGGHVGVLVKDIENRLKEGNSTRRRNIVKNFLDPYKVLLEYSYGQVTKCESNLVTFSEANNKLQPMYTYSRLLSKLSMGNVSSNIHSLVNLCFITGLDLGMNFSKEPIVSLIVPFKTKGKTTEGFITKIISNVNVLGSISKIQQAFKKSLIGELMVNQATLVPSNFEEEYTESIKQLQKMCNSIYIGFTDPEMVSLENNYNEWVNHSLYDAYRLKDTQKTRPIIYTKYACGFLFEGLVAKSGSVLDDIARSCTESYMKRRKLMETDFEKNTIRNMLVDENISYVDTTPRVNKIYDIHSPYTHLYGLTISKITRKDLGTSSQREALNNWLLKRSIVGTFVLDNISDTDILNSDFTKDNTAETLYSEYYYDHDRDLIKAMETYVDTSYRAGKIDEMAVHDWFKLIENTRQEVENTPNKFYIDIGLQCMNKMDLNFTQRITFIPGEDFVKVNNFVGEFKVNIQDVKNSIGENWEHLFSTLLTPIDFRASTQRRLLEYYI